MATKRVTLADVARLAGLSPTAASLILNGRPATRLSQDAVERVQAAAKELGYRPNVAARTLSTKRSRTIGFLSDTIATSRFAGPLILGALREARLRDHVLLITETEGSAEAEAEAAATLMDRQVDGVLFAGVRSHEVVIPAPLKGAPVVLLNLTSSTAAPQVLPDEYAGGRAVAAQLTAAGHRDGIVLVGATLERRHDPTTSTALRRRLQGISDQLDEDGARVLEAVGHEPWDPEVGYEAVRQLLDRRSPGMTALLCLNDRLAIGAYWAIQERDLRIPEDVSVVGFDGDEASLSLQPTLTTAALPHEEMGRLALQLLLDESRTLETLVPMPLRIGGSVSGPLQGDRAERSE